VFQAAIGRAARAGFWIKSGRSIEALSRTGRIWWDKTGTLTTGKMRVEQFLGDRSTAGTVLALERASKHPIARALTRELESTVAAAPPITNLRVQLGQGVVGASRGHEWRVGSEKFALHTKPHARGDLYTELAAAAEKGTAAGSTLVWVGCNGEARALFLLRDALRPHAKESLADLRRLGWLPGILSGDHPGACARVASEVQIPAGDVHAGLTPEAKLAAVKTDADSESGTVLMVGDGVNDAAALARADCGIALKGGAEASLRSAQVYVADGDLGRLPELIHGARRTLGTVKRCMLFALLYNAIAVAGVLQGWIHPMIAAGLMPLSSVTVVAIAYRSRSFDSPDTLET